MTESQLCAWPAWGTGAPTAHGEEAVGDWSVAPGQCLLKGEYRLLCTNKKWWY